MSSFNDYGKLANLKQSTPVIYTTEIQTHQKTHLISSHLIAIHVTQDGEASAGGAAAVENLLEGARGGGNDRAGEKENSRDFALWKAFVPPDGIQ